MRRTLGLTDATVLGLASMLGAGVFAVFGPAAQSAGSGLLLGLGIAGAIAYCNATSSAQLAAQYPVSGGTYVYGRERLGEWWGYLAGWGFIVGKTASCAAMALTFAAYVAPAGWERPVAVAAVLSIGAVNYRGIERTARLARVILALVLLALAIVVAAGLSSHDGLGLSKLDDTLQLDGVLQSAGFLFFAFAGYARIATMGEEVRDPERTIPRAIHLAIGSALVIYAAVAVTLLWVLGADGIAGSAAPLADCLERAGWGAAGPVLRLGAAAACLGALLALMAGVGRTVLAMARTSDLPPWLGAIHPRHRVPHRAEATLTVVACGLVALGDLRTAIGFSSFSVLFYYFVTNVSAFTQSHDHRRYPRTLSATGAVGCVGLVASLPGQVALTAVAVFVVGAAYRFTRRSADGTAR